MTGVLRALIGRVVTVVTARRPVVPPRPPLVEDGWPGVDERIAAEVSTPWF
ncbi:hypothetical protein GCM10027258_63050 [Amycolatopsis stemonae]